MHTASELTPIATAAFTYHGASITLTAPNGAALLEDLARFSVGTKADTPAPAKDKAEGKPKAVEKAAAPAASAEPAPSPAPAPAAAAKESAPADKPKADAVDYPTLQKAVFALAGKGTEGRAAAGELAQSFSVKTFKELAPEKWGAALVAVNAKIAEFETADAVA